MKRKLREAKDIPVDHQSTGNIKSDLTEKQLAAFGAAVLAYNVLEDQIDTLLLVATRIPDWLFPEVSSRIHGLEGKIAIIREAIKQSGLGPNDTKTLTGTIDVFLDFKKTRDTLIHARIINASLGVGRGAKQRGKSPFEILLSASALDVFYDHILALRMELASGGSLLNSAVALKECALDDPNRPRFILRIRLRSRPAAATIRTSDFGRASSLSRRWIRLRPDTIISVCGVNYVFHLEGYRFNP
jgi:hypothetical protein